MSQDAPLYSRPVVALTAGDVAGIGPEVCLRACLEPAVRELCSPLLVCHPAVMERAAQLLGVDVRIVPASSPKDATLWNDAAGDRIVCWNPADDAAAEVPPGRLDARAGEAAYRYLIAAIEAARNGRVDAITTAPLNKAALHLAGRKYPGHTEILAEACGVERFAMTLYLPPGDIVRSPQGLGVAHVTLHTSLRSVPDLLSTPKVIERIELIDRFMRDVGCTAPRIGVCALNPHAGEDGLFGDEESRIIGPAVAAAQRSGAAAAGPFPADTLLRRAVSGEFDGVVAMYHDQGHIAFKLIGFDAAVNVTLGLPIVRTSPSHGTAFDIAWQGKANADGMVGAIRVAALLARNRRAAATPVDAPGNPSPAS